MAKSHFALIVALILMATVPANTEGQTPPQEATARAAIDAAFLSTDDTVLARALVAESSLTEWPASFTQAYGARQRLRGVLLTLQAQAMVSRLAEAEPRNQADVQRALNIANRALELLPANTYPDEAANAHYIIGRAYRLVPTGDPARDNASALANFVAADELGPHIRNGAIWGRIALERAQVILDIDPNSRDSLTRVIDLYVSALSHFGAVDELILRAVYTHKLGLLYNQRNQAGDLHASIAAYRQSLALYRRAPGGEAFSADAHMHLASALFARAGQVAGADTLAAIAEAAAAREQSSPSRYRNTWLDATNLMIHATYNQYDDEEWQPIIPLAREIMDAWQTDDPIEPLVNAALYGGTALISQRGQNTVANAERAVAYFDRAIAEGQGRITSAQMRQLEGMRSAARVMTGQTRTAEVVAVNSCDDVPLFLGAWMTQMQNSGAINPEFAATARRAIELCAAAPSAPEGNGFRFYELSFLNFGLVATETPTDWSLLDRATEYAERALQAPDIRNDQESVAQVNALIALIATASQAHEQRASTVDLVRSASGTARQSTFGDDRQGVLLAMLSAASNSELGHHDQAQRDVDAGAAIIDRLIGAGLSEREIRYAQRPARLLFEAGAAIALRRHDPAAAFAYVERSHAQLLRAAIRADEAQLPAQDHARLIALRADLQRREAALNAAAHPTIAALNEAQGIRQLAANILAQSHATGARASITPIVAIVISNLQSAILVRAGGATRATNLDNIDTDLLDQALREWKAAYTSEDMTRAIADFRLRFEPMLGGAVRASLAEAGIAPGSRIALMPEAGLSLLPLALLRDANGRTLLDDYQVVLTPSEYALGAAEARARAPSSDHLIAFWNDTLPLAEAEATFISSTFPVSTRSVINGAAVSSPEAALQALSGASYWHFSTHGFFNWDEPSRSGLILSSHTTLTLKDIVQSGEILGRPRLIVLSACETGLADIAHDPNEFIGLPAAFIESGGAGVIASLWPVEDSAATLLFAKFYALQRQNGMTPPEALRLAQLWLRDASHGEITQFIDSAQRSATPHAFDQLRSAVADLEGDHPFGDATYWGAWVYYGA